MILGEQVMPYLVKDSPSRPGEGRRVVSNRWECIVWFIKHFGQIFEQNFDSFLIRNTMYSITRAAKYSGTNTRPLPITVRGRGAAGRSRHMGRTVCIGRSGCVAVGGSQSRRTTRDGRTDKKNWEKPYCTLCFLVFPLVFRSCFPSFS